MAVAGSALDKHKCQSVACFTDFYGISFENGKRYCVNRSFSSSTVMGLQNSWILDLASRSHSR
jgi:hypothetical protein